MDPLWHGSTNVYTVTLAVAMEIGTLLAQVLANVNRLVMILGVSVRHPILPFQMRAFLMNKSLVRIVRVVTKVRITLLAIHAFLTLNIISNPVSAFHVT
tara:strand:- start:399 stop:695 length:297 start_codon:yes stop_codon:yes gene_type:complete